MPNPNEPREAEPVAVTLVRIETGVGNILEKVTDLKAEVVIHRGQIGSLQSEMQQVRSDQATAAKDLKAADKAREDTAAALEKQTAAQVLKAKDAVDSATRQTEASAQKSASIWSPFARTLTVIAALTGAGVLLLMWLRG